MAEVDNDNVPLLDRPQFNEEGQLNDVFMELILEFQAVTGMEDMEESRRILERHDWDLLVAISAHLGFDAGTSSPRHRNVGDQDPSPSTSRGIGVGVGSDQVIGVISRRPSGRVLIGRGENPGWFGWIWKIVTSPVEFFMRYFWDYIYSSLQYLRPLPRQDPVQDVLDFIRSYEEKYGNEHPNFYPGTYGQALSDAKKELKFLLVYLHCDDHVDTHAFCTRVMPHEGFRQFIQENMLFWACSVALPEGHRTSQALRENTYPFLGLVVLKANRMTIVGRVEGVTNPDEVLNRLHQVVADNEAYLVAERQERQERSMTQTLRQEQDEAYRASLLADQEKDRRKKEEQDKIAEAERQKQQLILEEQQRRDELKRQKNEAAKSIKPEPSKERPDTVKVVIKLPCGTRLERRFLKSDSLYELYLFVFSHTEAPDYFEIATNFPKRTLQCQPAETNPTIQTFEEAGLKNEMLFVYNLEA